MSSSTINSIARSSLIRIALVDEHRIFRDALESLLTKRPGIIIVTGVSNETELFESFENTVPDIVVFNAAALSARNHADFQFKSIVLYSEQDLYFVEKHADFSNEIFLPKSCNAADLFQAIDCIMENPVHFGYPGIAVKKELELARASKSLNNTALTRRETEIIQLICSEKSSPEIAELLNISIRTVENHRQNISRKTETKSLIGLHSFAISNRLVLSQ